MSKKNRSVRHTRRTSTPCRDASSAVTAGHDPCAERESDRYDRPIPSRLAILNLLEENGELLPEAQIAQALGLGEAVDLDALHKRLSAMVRDGQLLRGRRGRYALTRKLDLIPGTVLANAEGYGFLRPEEGGDDLYLSPQQMRKVLHGDRILASVVSVDRRGRYQGAIVEVLQRRSPRLVGRVMIENGVTWVVPDDRRIHQNIMIRSAQVQDVCPGQIVIAEIVEPPSSNHVPVGVIRMVLGASLKPSLLVEMAIASHDVRAVWPEEVVREASGIATQVMSMECDGRVDLRALPLLTIDGADARDFDDAVYAEPMRDGTWRLVVAIADVSHYVGIDSALDKEALERSTSTYFPGFVVPMLPEALSNGICSLNPQVDRLCLACDMQIDATGTVTGSRFYRAVMRSCARLTYDQVWQAVGMHDPLVRDELADVLEPLEHLHALYKIMVAQRRQRGAIDFEVPEIRFCLDADGEVVPLGASERHDAHKLIEECMITANVQAAMFLQKKNMPTLFRVHEAPPSEKYADLQQFLCEFGLKLPSLDEVRPGDFADMLRLVQDRPERELIAGVLLRAQSMAAYQVDNRGHFGLALSAYAHFTSPIRRYPDLLVHRAIAHVLDGGSSSNYHYTNMHMTSMATHCSQRERCAEEAERDVNERFKCAWMSRHVGCEFDGVITGVTSFGLFIELEESRVSGLVHISQLSNDYYHFDPKGHVLEGERSGTRFRLGDYVRVQVLKASLEDRKVDFRLVRSRTPRRDAATANAVKPYNYPAAGAHYHVLPQVIGAAAKSRAEAGKFDTGKRKHGAKSDAMRVNKTSSAKRRKKHKHKG